MGELLAVTYQDHDTLVIVFGAGGRLGRVLLPILAAGPWVVVAVTRKDKPIAPPSNTHWIQIDVTEVDLWERGFRVFCGMADIHDRVIIVDLLLDKTTITTMRRSLAAGTAYIARLRSRLIALNRPSSLVHVSTTAVLAPWLYQTPYGLAKRRQLARYASARVVGQALLLPSLVDAEPDRPATSAHLVWTYAKAAAHVRQAVGEARANAPTALRLIVPQVDRSRGSSVRMCRPRRLRTFTRLLELHVASCFTQRDSPQAHRVASHGRLELTPRRLRQRVDHHIVPTGLVRRLVRRLSTAAEERQP